MPGTRAKASYRVLVADTDSQDGLAVLRSLGRRGIETHAAETRPGGLGGYSRFCRGYICLSPNMDDFVDEILTYIRRHGITHLIATSERNIFLLNERRAEVEGAVQPLFPGPDVVERAFYKDRTLATAQRCGIPVPRTIYLRTRDDAVACKDFRFPVIIKPRHRSPRGGAHTRFHSKVLRFESLTELLEEIPPYLDINDPVMAQEFTEGCGLGIELLLRSGELVCAAQHIRVREDPPSGGVSVYCRTVPLDPGLVRQSVELLRAMEWEGVAMLEYKWQAEAHHAVLMEVNGRFWGSLPLALHAGADFPYLLFKSSLGKCEPQIGKCEPQIARAGVWTRWLFGDSKWLYKVLRERSDGRLSAVSAYVAAFRPGVKYFIWSADDPMPAVRRASDRMRQLIRTGSLRNHQPE